jgi:hypothetical protein
MLEKIKHAELLLEYGANPVAANEFGSTPLHLVPSDAVRSTKLYFKKIFDDAIRKRNEEAIASGTVGVNPARGSEL